MMNRKLLGLGVLLAGLSAIGCESKPATPPKAAAKVDHDHAEEGPHGGAVIELGKYHGEFVVDHGKKQATVYILDGKLENPAPIGVSKLTLSIKQPAFQAELVPAPQDGDPKGKCSRFVATHENFGKEQEFEGTLSGEIDGKPYSSDFKEEAHDHGHGKK